MKILKYIFVWPLCFLMGCFLGQIFAYLLIKFLMFFNLTHAFYSLMDHLTFIHP